MRSLLGLILVAALATPGWAEPKVTVVVEGLHNPTAVVQQRGGDLFVAESGAGRVVRIVDGKAKDAIVGWPIDRFGMGPIFDIGPLGLSFLSDKQLVVGDGGLADGKELVRVFDVPARDAEPLKFDAPVRGIGPLAAGEGGKDEGNFFGVVAIPQEAIFFTTSGDDEKGWIARSVLAGTKWGDPERFIATREASGATGPGPIILDKAGQLVVGQMGQLNTQKDSRLTIYHPRTGRILLNLETGLYDITGLGYSPSAKGLLYAVDFAWMAPEEGGLFRLDARRSDAGQTIKATKILPLERPTAMCFGADGALYVTLFGKDANGAKTGKLVKIELDEK